MIHLFGQAITINLGTVISTIGIAVSSWIVVNVINMKADIAAIRTKLADLPCATGKVEVVKVCKGT